MPYYNPKMIDFNHATMRIEPVKEVGSALYDIYQNNVANKQNQMKIDEINRHNMEAERIDNDRLNEAINNNKRTFEFNQNKFNVDNDQWQKDYNLRSRQLAESAELRRQQQEWNAWLKQKKIEEQENKINTEKQKQIDEANLYIDYAKNNPEAFKGANIDNINDPILAAKALKLAFDTNKSTGSLVDRNKVKQDVAMSLTGTKTLLNNLQNVKNIYDDSYVGWIDDGIHKIASILPEWMRNTEMARFRALLDGAKTDLKSMQDTGKITNQQYNDLLAVLPRKDETNQGDFKEKWDGYLDRVTSIYRNKIAGLKASGANTAEFDKDIEEIENWANSLHFNKGKKTMKMNPNGNYTVY
ncbi:hypothetical protein CPIN17260_1082 [Campylobacter pinnipediorum subsp. pinnipediorum]|uniref:Uncharacterized protein n=1 Tax=Campylobacter pinnipediorum subsp. pinnipediorum TaxID=1660067 RepID=A0AAX0L9M2_9BACT|nr:hypothetical protein [Campylobacter pinnipediorum]AQW81371.1 hypothetical protein CPIN17260_1082 [Campylobacter pinnipediorum subsp. pinnipediorum]OPA77339.1 hypothetical protein BFG04_04385 [Campylobacter pinnipediorum subsp. pinnipediorum]